MQSKKKYFVRLKENLINCYLTHGLRRIQFNVFHLFSYILQIRRSYVVTTLSTSFLLPLQKADVLPTACSDFSVPLLP